MLLIVVYLPRAQTSLSLDENVRAKEGGKETLPMVLCGSSPVARLYLAKNEVPEEEAGVVHGGANVFLCV